MNELYGECFITFLEKTNTEILKKKHKETARRQSEIND